MAAPIIYIFINKSLNMTSGKIAAQAAHAAVMTLIDAPDWEKIFWENSPARTIIILEARDSEHLTNIDKYLAQRSVRTSLIIDEGINEIDSHTPTALGTQILDKDNENVPAIFSSFRKYQDFIRATIEFER